MLRPKYTNHRAHMKAKLLKLYPARGYNSQDMDPNNSTPAPSMHNPLQVMSPGERVICEIKRHPFGLIGLYGASALLIVLSLAGSILTPTYFSGLSGNTKGLLVAGALLLSVLVLGYTYIAALIYNGNRWVVTSDSITQMTQTGLFSKQTSQLSLANLEDVTFEQNSLIQTMFGFGTLKVETAGERAKFTFPYCPNPAQCARDVIKAHEDFIQAHPEEGQMVPPATYNPQYQMQQPVQQPPQPVNPVPGQPVYPPAPGQPPTNDNHPT
jgi:hypothetical protein